MTTQTQAIQRNPVSAEPPQCQCLHTPALPGPTYTCVAIVGLGKDYSTDDAKLRDFLQFYSNRVNRQDYVHSQQKPLSIRTVLPDVKEQDKNKNKRRKKNVGKTEEKTKL